MDPSVLPMWVRMVAVTAPVFRSTRDTVSSLQLGTQRLPKPAARPEHGPLPTGTVAATRFVFGSSRVTASFGLFEIHTASSTAIQSGAPGTANTASGFSRSIGILTPGVLTPGLGGVAVCISTTEPSQNAIAVLIISTVHNNVA